MVSCDSCGFWLIFHFGYTEKKTKTFLLFFFFSSHVVVSVVVAGSVLNLIRACMQQHILAQPNPNFNNIFGSVLQLLEYNEHE